MKSAFPDEFTFSLEEYLVGNVLYESRGFSANEYKVPEDQRSKPNLECMLPLGDMFNHTSSTKVNMAYTYDY